MSQFINPADAALPGLATAVDPVRLREFLGVENSPPWSVGYLRYQRGKRCRAAYFLSEGKPGRNNRNRVPMGYAVACREREFRKAVDALGHGSWVTTGKGVAFAALAEEQIFFLRYPNDRRLNALRVFATDETLQNFLRELLPRDFGKRTHRWDFTLIRYKPESRAVFRFDQKAVESTADNPGFYMRITPNGRAGQEFKVLQGLHEQLRSSEELQVPEPMAVTGDGSVIALGVLPGRPWETLLGSNDECYASKGAAIALARLHACTSPVDKTQPVAETFAATQNTLAWLADVFPDWRESLDNVARRLLARMPAEGSGISAFLHGDFHPGQVLVKGEHIGFVDFERAHQGSVESELGMLAAHLHYKQPSLAWEMMKNFVDHYSGAAGTLPDRELVNWWTAVALVQIMIKPVRRLSPRASKKVTALLARLQLILEEQ